MIEAALASPRLAPVYSYRHRVSFEDTNLVGNVYFARFLSWQGRCRELFLLEHAPSVLADLAGSLRLVTLNVSCEYFAELRALDEVEVKMSLAHIRQHRIGLAFDYVVLRNGADVLAARGAQEVGCMRDAGKDLVPTPLPKDLKSALEPYR
jgi:enediyne biosynthesis thioesterase